MRILSALLTLTLASSAVLAAPYPDPPPKQPCSTSSTAPSEPSATLTSPYTLTAFAPTNQTFNGLKVNNLNLFQEKVGQYCPSPPVTVCPNGTDQVWFGTLTPSVTVPGGQALYVTSAGRISITVQHSHVIPPDAFWNYQGWTWVPLTPSRPGPDNQYHPTVPGCPSRDPLYNCAAPSGYWTFQAPNATRGGVLACPIETSPGAPEVQQWALWARTPAYVERSECVELVGLGTQAYAGVVPPVWAY